MAGFHLPMAGWFCAPTDSIERSDDVPGEDPPREVVDHRSQVDATAVEQADQRGVDVPDFVNARSADAHFGLGGMEAMSRPSPAMDVNQSPPRAGRGKNLAESLRQASQSAGGHMPVLLGSDHVADRVDFLGCELLWRTPRAAGAVVEPTSQFTLPGVKPGVRQPDDAKHRAQREVRACPFDRLQQAGFRQTFRDLHPAQRSTRELEQQRHQPQQRHKAVDSPPQRNDLSLQANGVLVECVQRHDRCCRGRKPPSRCGPGHSVTYGHVYVLGIADQFPEAVIVTALEAGG